MCATRRPALAKLVRDVSCVGDWRQSGLVPQPDQIAATRDQSFFVRYHSALSTDRVKGDASTTKAMMFKTTVAQKT